MKVPSSKKPTHRGAGKPKGGVVKDRTAARGGSAANAPGPSTTATSRRGNKPGAGHNWSIDR